MQNEKPTDELISNAAIQKLHKSMIVTGPEKLLNDLLEREGALGAYVMFAGYQMSEMVKQSGAAPNLVEWVKQATMSYALVIIAAQSQAHLDLWRDFMPDSATLDSPIHKPQNPQGEDHGRSH